MGVYLILPIFYNGEQIMVEGGCTETRIASGRWEKRGKEGLFTRIGHRGKEIAENPSFLVLRYLIFSPELPGRGDPRHGVCRKAAAAVTDRIASHAQFGASAPMFGGGGETRTPEKTRNETKREETRKKERMGL